MILVEWWLVSPWTLTARGKKSGTTTACMNVSSQTLSSSALVAPACLALIEDRSLSIYRSQNTLDQKQRRHPPSTICRIQREHIGRAYQWVDLIHAHFQYNGQIILLMHCHEARSMLLLAASASQHLPRPRRSQAYGLIEGLILGE